MAEQLGALEYDLKISEENLDKTIADIEKKLQNFNKKAEKLLTIDAKRTKQLSEEQKQLRMINVTTTQRLVNAQKVAVAEAKTAAVTQKNAQVAVDAANKQLVIEEKLRLAKSQTAASQVRLANAQKRSLTTINKVNNAYKKQSLYLQNLNTMAANYISAFAALRLSQQIAKVTGQFELQRKALAAIIQNKDEADRLFTRVTEVALKSPFNIRDLLAYTKMLAAYRIESSELISTLGKLGDVSAGLGVDMSRLILAFGQVKAAQVLRGQEVRQFTEAGIPIIGLLADKFSELEGRVVSTNEVFEKISKRMVAFSTVSDIFDEMTSKGGIFFEAQLVQAETLAGMMSIFQDALDKAMNAIGEEDINILKGTVALATSLVDSWRTVLQVLRVIITTYGVYRAALFFLNKQRVIGNTLIRHNVTSLAQLSAATELQMRREIALSSVSARLGNSMKKLGVFMRSNALLLGITAIAALGTAIYEAAKEANRLRNELDELTVEEFTKTQSLVENFKNLANAAVKAADGSHNQREALAELRRTYKDYIPLQELNIQNLKDLKGNYDLLTTAIYNKARARAYEKGQEKITAATQEERAKATEALISGLIDADIVKRDAVNIVKIFRDELIKSGGDAGKVLQRVVDQYMGEQLSLADAASNLDWKTFLTGFDRATESAYNYGGVLLRATQAQDNFNASMEAQFGGVSSVLKSEREAMDEITSLYNKEKSDLNNLKLTKEEYSERVAELTEQELQARIDYYKTIQEGENEIYATDRIDQYTKQLEALNKEGSAYQKLISKIIEEARGEDETIGVKLEVLEGEDTAIHMKRIVTEYKDYKKLIGETESVIKAYRKTQQDGWQKAIEVSEKELSTLKANLKVTEAIGVALGLVFKTKKEAKKEEDKALDNLKAQLKAYKEINKVNENLIKTLGVKEASLTIEKLFGKQIEDLKIEIPTDLKSDELINLMAKLADKAEKLGTDAGKKWAKGIRLETAKLKADNLIKAHKEALKKIDDEIKNYKEKSDLYDYIFGITKDKAFSFKIAFDVDTTGLEEIITKEITAIDQEVAIKIKGAELGQSFEELFTEEELSALKKRISEEDIKIVKKWYKQLDDIKEKSFKDEITRLAKTRTTFLTDEKKKLAIKAKFDQERRNLDSKYNTQTAEEKEAALKEINKAEGKELAAIDSVILASTKAYKALYSDMERFSVKKMKNIAKVWDDILKAAGEADVVDGKLSFKFEDMDGTLTSMSLTEEQLEKLKVAVGKLKTAIGNKNPFEKISEGIRLIGEGSIDEGLAIASEGVKSLMDTVYPLTEALVELADATEDNKMRQFAEDMQLALEWGKKLLDLGVAIARAFAGDPSALPASLLDITATLIKAEAGYQKAKRAFLADNLKMQREYILLLLEEQLLFSKGVSIFGLNQFGALGNAMNVATSATKEYSKEILKLSDLEIKVGTKRKKFLGITVGHKNVYADLLETFPDLIRGYDGVLTAESKLNIERAKAILATDKLTSSGRAQLEQLIALQEQADEALQVITDYLSETFGTIGSEISDAIVSAFRDGTDAGIAFADSMTKTMEKLTQDIANSMILAPYFKDFEDQLNKIYKDVDLTPEEQLAATTRIMAEFYAGLKDEQEEYNKFLQQSQEIAAKYGIDLFEATDKDLTALTKGIQGLTEDTGRRLEALFNSTREVNIEMNSKMSYLIDSMNSSNIINSEILSVMQTLNNNLVNYIETFNSIIKQGSAGSGIKIYMEG